MPPRKSTENKEDGGANSTPKRSTDSDWLYPPQDLTLPRSMIQRLAKGVLPPNTQIQRDALLAMSKSATVFVNYLASSANDRAQLAGKKTIQPDDVRTALPELEFEDFLPRCNAELEKYNEVQCDKRNSYRRRIKEEKAAAARDELHPNGETEDAEAVSSPHEDKDELQDGERARKRQRMSAWERMTSFAGLNIMGQSEMNGNDDDGDTVDEEEEADDAEMEDEEDDDAEEDGESDAEAGREDEEDDPDIMQLRQEEEEDDLDAEESD